MVEETHVALRVLYTINTSPQYILAKSPEKIPLVTADDSLEANGLPVYGRAPLKTCALAICRSSPEIAPDPTRDYSVYVLDPMEDLMSKERRGQSSSSAGGVAVGMGLFSQILSPFSSDPTTVIGTIINCGNGKHALEVVLSLRQMTPPAHPIPILAPQVEGQMPFAYHHNPMPGPSKPVRKAHTSSPFTSAPLPSFQERSFHHYTYGSQFPNQIQAQAQVQNDKKNPAHDTRAFQFPTPYIGPPKRKPGRPSKKETTPSSDGTGDIQIVDVVQSTPDPDVSPPAASFIQNDYLPTPPSSQPAEPQGTQSNTSQEASDAPFDITQNAVMLAALSAVNAGNSGTSPLPQEAPNEALVAFLKAYLSALEGQKSTPITNPPPQASAQAAQPSREVAIRDKWASERTELIDLTNKENVKPQKQQSQEKEDKHSPPLTSNTPSSAPLGLSRLNSQPDLKAQGSEDNAVTLSSDDLQPSSSGSRKRRLSESIRLDEIASRSRRKSNLNRCASDSIGPDPRVNSGWGGLRIRSDANLGSSQLPRVASSSSFVSDPPQAPPQQTAFFKATCTTASVRKGPFVVPDWARNVPPPPPSRPSGESVEGRPQPSKKRTKSKGLGRLGGQQLVRRVSDGQASSSRLEPSPDLIAPLSPARGENKQEVPKTSPVRSPMAVLMPVFAQSSPVVKASYTSLFHAFQTSPRRPRTSSESLRRSELPLTPRKQNSSTPLRGSVRSLTRSSSLFTPSPLTDSIGVKVCHQSLFELMPDPPPSPTPSKRRVRTPKSNAYRPNDSCIKHLTPRTLEKTTKIQDDNGALTQELLPTSSEPDYESSSVLPCSSSDFTITTPFKIHDWSSFDLPPSSPPPPSSPSLPAATYDSDLPCSDIPSSDFDFGDTPSSTAGADADSVAPTPQESTEVPPSATSDITNFAGIEFLSDWDFTGSDIDMVDGGPQDGTAADEALEAIRNGIGQEDFSEAWNLLNSVLFVPNGSADTQPMAMGTGSDFHLFSQPNDTTLSSETDTNFSDIDYANLVASNFEDLLKGCLV